MKKDVTFYWNNDYKKSLDILKERMISALILVFLIRRKSFMYMSTHHV